jgi:transposase
MCAIFEGPRAPLTLLLQHTRLGISRAPARRRVVQPARTSCPCCGSTKLSKVREDATEILDVVPAAMV